MVNVKKIAEKIAARSEPTIKDVAEFMVAKASQEKLEDYATEYLQWYYEEFDPDQFEDDKKLMLKEDWNL